MIYSAEQKPHRYQQSACSHYGFAGPHVRAGITSVFAVALAIFQEYIVRARSHQTESFVAHNARFTHVCTTAEITPNAIHCETKKRLMNDSKSDGLTDIEIPFWRIFRHMVGRTPGKWANSGCCLQSVIDSVLLSNGSAHFGSASERQSQHFILKTVKSTKMKHFIMLTMASHSQSFPRKWYGKHKIKNNNFPVNHILTSMMRLLYLIKSYCRKFTPFRFDMDVSTGPCAHNRRNEYSTHASQWLCETVVLSGWLNAPDSSSLFWALRNCKLVYSPFCTQNTITIADTTIR